MLNEIEKIKVLEDVSSGIFDDIWVVYYTKNWQAFPSENEQGRDSDFDCGTYYNPEVMSQESHAEKKVNLR